MKVKNVLDEIYHMKFLNEIEITNLLKEDTFLDSKEGYKDSGIRNGKLDEKELKREDFDKIIELILNNI